MSGPAKDFFVSYTGADVGWAEWIADQLEAAGYSTVLQAWDFRPGENFIRRMDQALVEADRVVAVLSPRYFASAYATDEWTAALVRGAGESDRLLPVRIEACDLPPLIANRIYIDLVGVDEPAAAVRLRAGVVRRRARPPGKRPFPGAAAAAARRRFPGRRPEVFGVPPRNRNFTGRDELLKQIRRTLRTRRAGSVVQAGAVHGLGGIGKTQLALEYAHRHAADYDVIWWVPAEEPLAIAGQLAGLARRLGLPELADQEEQLSLLWDELGRRDRWLLVYDNASQPRDLATYRPPAGRGHLLITSRNPAWASIATPLQVDVLSRAEAVAFLQVRLGRDEPAAGQLAAALGDLPLALEQAAAYLEQTHTALHDYLRLLEDRAGEVLGLGELADYPHSVASAWSLSLRRVRDEAPAAEDLLAVCAFLAPDDIPRSLPTEQAAVLPNRLQQATADQLAYDRMLGALGRYALMAVTEDALGVHRLVQMVIREGFDQQAKQYWAGVAVRLLWVAFPDGDVQAWSACARLLPHALAVAEHASALDTEGRLTADLLNKAAGYLWRRAELGQARQLLEGALAILETEVGPDHLDVALNLGNLGLVLSDLGELSVARGIVERALAIRQGQLGPDHLDVAQTLNELGIIRWRLGQLSAGRTALQRALAIREAQLGPNHLDVARTLDNLGIVLLELGELSAARALFQRALPIAEAELGPDHPEIANSLDNLGVLLRNVGELPAAVDAHLRALAIRETQLGPDHPEVARSIDNLGTTLHDAGQLAAARDARQHALAIRETQLGPDHPEVAASLNNLGVLLLELGELAAARDATERALAIFEARLSPDHPSVIMARANLSRIVAASTTSPGSQPPGQ